ncbi:MAG: hypothetical protein ACOWYE_17035, partial [Desulfatiglandales bacterium]
SHYKRGSGQRPALLYYSYNDEISDAEYQQQLYKVAAMKSPNYNLAEVKAALEYVLWFRMDREEIEFTDRDYRKAKKYVVGLSPQMRGKLRKDMLEEAEQVLAEMIEVREWNVKFDRIEKANSLPVEDDLNKVIKYENSLERSIFRNLAALKSLQESRARAGDRAERYPKLPPSTD